MKKRNNPNGYLAGKKGHRDGNRYETHGDITTGYTSKKESFTFSAKHLNLAMQYTWSIDKEGYVNCSVMLEKGKYEHVKLHRLILGLVHNDGKIVDHINRNKSNNEDSNLRIVTTQENSQNRNSSKNSKSGTIGVFYRQRDNKIPRWVASINIDGKTVQIGQYETKEEAMFARKEAELKHYNGIRYNEEGK